MTYRKQSMDVQKMEYGRTENGAWTYRKRSMAVQKTEHAYRKQIIDVQKKGIGLREKRIFCIRAGCKAVARNTERNSIKGRKIVIGKDE